MTVGALPQTPPKAPPLETAKGALPPWIPVFLGEIFIFVTIECGDKLMVTMI